MRLWSPALVVALAVSPAVLAQTTPDDLLEGMKAGDGLQVELFAREPLLLAPTALDVDPLGRVWVTEGVNAHCKRRRLPLVRPEGDRIRVLLDPKGEGRATQAVTFYQGPELVAPLGICVLPSRDGGSLRVLVAQSPDILEFTCKDATNPVADGPPRVFLTGFGGVDRTNGVHGLTTGPDGKLYFTVGDGGVVGLQARDGKGRKWESNATDCRAGTVWRCDLDGNNLERVAHNFRNPYDCCIDSFGEIWLADRGADGSQQTRLCLVFPGGDFAYQPSRTDKGAWQDDQPGVVPTALATGSGSPLGLACCEGSLLPPAYRGQLLQCESATGEVRCFRRKPKGAGYELEGAALLQGTPGRFRPGAVRVAPDGSVFVADGDDPKRGRIFRVTPVGHKGYRIPEIKLKTEQDLVEALGSPLRHVNGLALEALRDAGRDRLEGVAGLARKQHPVVQARVLWACTRPWLGGKDGSAYDVLTSPRMLDNRDATLLPLAIRIDHTLLGRSTLDGAGFQKALEEKRLNLDDLAIDACRELLLGARTCDPEAFRPSFYQLLKRYDGSDRFYRAALGLACGPNQERRQKLLADFDKRYPQWDGTVADIVRELRPKCMLPKMRQLLDQPVLRFEEQTLLFEILLGYDDPEVGLGLFGIYENGANFIGKRRWAMDYFKRNLPGRWAMLKEHPTLIAFITKGFQGYGEDRENAIELAGLSGSPKVAYLVRRSALSEAEQQQSRAAAIRALGNFQSRDEVNALEKIARTSQAFGMPQLAVRSLGRIGTPETVRILQKFFLDEKDRARFRGDLLDALAASVPGSEWLLKQREDGKFPADMAADAGRLLRSSPFEDVREKAFLLFPPPAKLDPKHLPSLAELTARRPGDAGRGRQILMDSLKSDVRCLQCHTYLGRGVHLGPDLSVNLSRWNKEKVFNALLHPSKEVAERYTTWKLDPEGGPGVTGVIVREDATTITVRDANGKTHHVPVKGTQRTKVPGSLMPDSAVAALTADDLLDLVEFLQNSYAESLTPDRWYVAGPFITAGFNQTFGPEKQPFDPKATFKVGDQVVGWQTLDSGTAYVDLAGARGVAPKDGVTYLAVQVDVPQDESVRLRIGTDHPCRVFVNGTQVFGHDRDEPANPDRDDVQVHLKKGPNTILLKLRNGAGADGFYFTMTHGYQVKLVE